MNLLSASLGLLLSVSLGLNCSAQVFTNADFEDFTDCPEFLGEVGKAEGWITVITNADYYNCGFTAEVFPSPTEASSGTGYMGMGTYGNLNGSAESIGQVLSEPLVVGTTYSFTVDVKDVTGGSFGQDCTGLCIYGFVGQPTEGLAFIHTQDLEGAVELACSDQVSSSEWTTVPLSFTADQAYDFIVLTPGVSPQCYHYFFIDNIQQEDLVNVQETSAELKINTSLRRGDQLIISAWTPNFNIGWYDLSGRLIRQGTLNKVPAELTSGVYFVQVSESGVPVHSQRVLIVD
ncbi:T9SS type A sorting domain-containing protein [Sanyastnella coralliicola]|uniref:T9SS type A sorting domain-containing protein n=1 Tax=Sanyastnella coralliicola TaxID=3069118 RepID=UPI0027BA0B2F|nr:T9SS type A sorting domain-containing protein [Longitalea sp. SCSIO 12813]